jgi:hypothetical protein
MSTKNITQKTTNSVMGYIDSFTNEQIKQDSLELVRILKTITGCDPKIWGKSIIGFGEYHYTYASGREGDWMIIGLAPKKDRITLYFADYFSGYEELLQDIGVHKKDKSCIHFNSVKDMNMFALKKLLEAAFQAKNS